MIGFCNDYCNYLGDVFYYCVVMLLVDVVCMLIDVLYEVYGKCYMLKDYLKY